MRGFRDLEARAQTAILLWDDHFKVEIREKEEEEEARAGETRRSASCPLRLVVLQAVCGTQWTGEGFDFVWLHHWNHHFYFITFYCKRLKKKKPNKEKLFDKTSVLPSLVVLRWHDTAGQRLTLPEALLSEDACQGRQPSATETTHTSRQRVQEPYATGRHQCVWDWERR